MRIIRSRRLRLVLALSFLAAVDGLLPNTVHGETRAAAALTPEAVWDAISAARDGDTVQLPEGTAVWKSGWNTGHWAKMKAITIQGARIDKTIIRDETSTAAGDADGDGVFEASPCYAWNNTFNGAKLNMVLRRWDPKQTELQASHVKEGRDFFNQEPKPDYYKPYAYPHPLQAGWEALMKSKGNE